jgi:hypothetical protein
MKGNTLSRLLSLICLISVALTAGCSSLASAGKSEVSRAQVQKLNEQLRSGQYRQIYQASAKTLQAGISEELFVTRINQAVRKMKAVDENLNFQESEMARSLSKLLNGEFWTNDFQKVEKNNRKIEFLTQWVKEEKDSAFKLRSLSIIEPAETGKFSVYYVEQEKFLTE